MALLPKQISYPAGDINVPGIFYLPDDRAVCAAVLVLHGSDGFKPNHEMIARKLAQEGFAAERIRTTGFYPEAPLPGFIFSRGKRYGGSR